MTDEENTGIKGIKVGDYVAATKFADGCVRDPWAIGFVKAITERGRVVVADNNGKVIVLANGFRRAKKISAERGAWACRNKAMIESARSSFWAIMRMSRADMASWENCNSYPLVH